MLTRCAALTAMLFIPPTHAGVRVRAHVTKTGHFVPAHVRSAPDRARGNNWSTQGNTNPYTGKHGTKRR